MIRVGAFAQAPLSVAPAVNKVVAAGRAFLGMRFVVVVSYLDAVASRTCEAVERRRRRRRRRRREVAGGCRGLSLSAVGMFREVLGTVTLT